MKLSGIEDALAVFVSEFLAKLLDNGGREHLSNIGLEVGDDARGQGSHPWPPGNDEVWKSLPFSREAAVCPRSGD